MTRAKDLRAGAGDARSIPVSYKVNNTLNPIPNPLGPAFLSLADATKDMTGNRRRGASSDVDAFKGAARAHIHHGHQDQAGSQ